MKHISPSTEKIRTFKETPIKDFERIVDNSRISQEKWKNTTIKSRIKAIKKLVHILNKDKEAIAKKITEDMGKPINYSLSEVEGTIKKINFFCNNAEKFLQSKRSSIFGDQIVHEPLGVVGVISPWNYPLSTSFTSIIPALLSGNSVIWKPSEFTPFLSKHIAHLFNSIKNVPENLLTVIIGGKEQGKELVMQDINFISFTGSTEAGKDIMKNSAKKLHKLVFELGGHDATIVLRDVDISKVAKRILFMSYLNSGQVCCSIKRVYVEEQIYDAFVSKISGLSKRIRIGDPNTKVEMGPIVSEEQLIKIESMIRDAKDNGAKILTGGKRLDMKGYYFPHTIIVNVNKDMLLMKEEPFGPILPIIPINNWQEGVESANDSRYGLTGSVWTNDKKLGKKIAEMLEVGVAGINTHGEGPIGMPWGGTKESGIGRLNSKEGFRCFTNVKVIRGKKI